MGIPGNITRYELLAANDVSGLGMFDRIGEALKYLIYGAGPNPDLMN